MCKDTTFIPYYKINFVKECYRIVFIRIKLYLIR